MLRLAVVTRCPPATHLEALFAAHEPIVTVLVLVGSGADAAARSAARVAQRTHPGVVHLDTEDGSPFNPRVLSNVARSFPVDAVIALDAGERLVLTDAFAVGRGLREAGSRQVRLSLGEVQGSSSPVWVDNRVWPVGRHQWEVLLGGTESTLLSSTRHPFVLRGVHIEQLDGPGTPAPDADKITETPSTPDSIETGAYEPWAAAGSGVDLTEQERPDGVFDPTFHKERLYLDLPPFELLADLTRPESVLDVGCGLGGYLAYLTELGATEVIGVDGFEEPAGFLCPGRFRQHDLREPLDLGSRFDVVISTEVIEHVDASHESVVLDTIERHASEHLLFSGARAGQPGMGHINCRSPEYWTSRWLERGWHVAVFPTLALRSVSTFHWFRRNLLFLTRDPETHPSPRFDESDLASFEASMCDWVGQQARVVRQPLTSSLAPVRTARADSVPEVQA